MPEAKFTAANAEMKIDLGDAGGKLSVGLTKEEVMKFANDPFWVSLRRILFVLFWILWIAMLAGAIVIIIMTPACAKPKEPLWYESSPIYTIRVDKFADSNGDGIGDLAGIISKLSYIQDDIFIRAVALDGLLDKNDPSAIRPKLGSLQDFKALASKIKVVIKVPLAEVVHEQDTSRDLDVAISYWLEAGAAGFILEEFDAEVSTHTDGLPRWFDLIANRSMTEESDDALLALATQNFKTLPNVYCRTAHMVLNYDMIRLSSSYDSSELYQLLLELAEKNGTSAGSCRDNFVLGTGEVIPLGERFNPLSRTEAMLIFNMLADATPIVYYGDEFGKKDTSSEAKSRELKQMPDPNTGKMEWNEVDHIKQHPERDQFKLFRQLTGLRLHEASIRTGTTAIRDLDSSVLAMARVKTGNPGFVVVSNFRSQPTTVNLLTSVSRQIPAQGSVVLTSTSSKRTTDTRVQLDALRVEGEETLVLQFVPNTEN